MQVADEGGGFEAIGSASGGGEDGAIVDDDPEGEVGDEEGNVDGGDGDTLVDGWY